MGELGKVLLTAVFLLWGLATAFAPLERKVVFLTGWARRSFVFAAGLSAITLILFTAAFLTDNFSIAAVAQCSSTKLPFYYKLSAVWAGSSGSLLLWAVAVFLLLALWQFEIRSTKQCSKFKCSNH